MNSNPHNPTTSGPETGEETLRLIASLPAPEGLEDRVHAALRAAHATSLQQPASALMNAAVFWPGPRGSSRDRACRAAGCAPRLRRPLCLWWRAEDGAFTRACSKASRPR